MIEDPPPPRSMRPRRLLWPAVGFVVLMTLPPAVAVALMGGALLARGTSQAVQHVRARDAEIEARAAAGPDGCDRS